MGIRQRLTASMLRCGVLMGLRRKEKALFPADVLEAHTVLVIVDPNAGIVVDIPNANGWLREDVENALMCGAATRWCRNRGTQISLLPSRR